MRNIALAVFAIIPLLATGVSRAEPPAGSVYLDGGKSDTALILAHGRGKDPRWKVVEPLRKGVNESLGYHTLSLQMPNEDKDWREYSDDFPRAYGIIEDAIRYLKDEKGITTVYLMGHSMGGRMASAFAADNPGRNLSGLIVAGCRNNGGHLLSCKENLQRVDIPVLDIWGADNDKDSDAAIERRPFVSARYQQKEIPGANHRFDGHEKEFVSVVISWLKAINDNHPTVISGAGEKQ